MMKIVIGIILFLVVLFGVHSAWHYQVTKACNEKICPEGMSPQYFRRDAYCGCIVKPQ